MRILSIAVGLTLAFAMACLAQSVSGKVLRWDTEPYGKNGNVSRNAAVYYIRVDRTDYQITKGTTKPDNFLNPGKEIKCRIDGNHMFITEDSDKEQKFTIIGSAEAN